MHLDLQVLLLVAALLPVRFAPFSSVHRPVVLPLRALYHHMLDLRMDWTNRSQDVSDDDAIKHNTIQYLLWAVCPIFVSKFC